MSAKPRIVREKGENGGIFADFYHGPAALVLYWPESCPYTPEVVVAVCERRQLTLATVPMESTCGWGIYTCWTRVRLPTWTALTPEFMGEPKKCAHECVEWSVTEAGRQCAMCGALLFDRRHGERRQLTKRRKVGPTYGGGRRSPKCPPNRRTGLDRRHTDG